MKEKTLRNAAKYESQNQAKQIAAFHMTAGSSGSANGALYVPPHLSKRNSKQMEM